MNIEEIGTRIEGLETQAAELLSKADAAQSKGDATELADVKAQLAPLESLMAELSAEKDKALLTQAYADVKAQVGSLESAIKDMRQHALPGDLSRHYGSEPSSDANSWYGKPGHSYYADVKAAGLGDSKAYQRIAQAVTGDIEGKALVESTDANGGYLVVPEISNELILQREQAAILRSLVSSITVSSDTLQIASVSGGMTAGWVAELAEKPESSALSFGQIATSVFTAAGLATVSNQLLADSVASVDQLVTRDLAKRLAFLEESAMLIGDGVGKPTGILNTSGVNPIPTSGSTINALVDDILDAIVAIQTNYQGEPDGIMMHPRTWVRFMKAPDALNASQFALTGNRAGSQIPQKTLLGYPVYLSSRIPTTYAGGVLGAGTESVVLVGNFKEALILDRQGITVDRSEHVRFTSNQTVFRVEERMGFTAARYPKAFSVISGTGLAGA